MPPAPLRQRFLREPTAARIVACYALFGALWIFFSDRLLSLLITDPALLTRLQTAKGWLFIAATALLLYLLIAAYSRRIRENDRVFGELVRGIAPHVGDDFFAALTRHLATAIGADCAFVGELSPSGRKAKTVAIHAHGVKMENFEYELAGTPCEEVAGGGVCYCPSGAAARFPGDRLLQEMEVDGYIGTPLTDAAGRAIGLLVVLNGGALSREPAATLLQIFAARAGAELERQRAERALQAQAEQLSAIFDSLQACVYVADIESYELLYMNRYAENAFGTDWKGKKCYDILQQEQGKPCAFCTNALLVEDGRPLPTHTWEFQNTVNRRWYQCMDRALTWPDGRLVRLEIALDITERKDLERLKDEMLSAVSHEMATPLTAIIGYVDFILDNHLAGEEVQSHLGTVRREADRLDALLKNFIAIGRLHARQAPPAFAAVDLARCVAGAAEAFRGASSTHRIVEELSADDLTVLGDEGALQQVVENLISNAIKYSPGGGEIVVSGYRQGDAVVVSVSDRGLGIPRDEFERIFDRFYRIDNSDTRRTSGSGLGLTLAREVVELHGGNIRVESTQGKGSTFLVSLPARGAPPLKTGGETTLHQIHP